MLRLMGLLFRVVAVSRLGVELESAEVVSVCGKRCSLF
ncbi:hypothetical protein VDG1235_1759 [Verrucomicrobiia bacterium DG1235]|nr:hypothetical protein VDG1235_1759 [Verrucomicrobiae bacterium DG1235]